MFSARSRHIWGAIRGRATWFAIGAATAALLCMFAPREAAAAGCYDDRTEALLSAVMALDRDNAVHFTKSGKPKVAALEVSSGLDTNAKERDKIWDLYAEWLVARDAEAAIAQDHERLRQEVAELSERNRELATDRAAVSQEFERLRSEKKQLEVSMTETTRDFNMLKEKYRAIARGENPCSSLASALEDSIGGFYAGRSEARRLVACLKVG